MVTVTCPHCETQKTLMPKTAFKLKAKGSVKLKCSECRRYFYACIQKKSDNNPVPLAVLAALDVGVEAWKRLPPEKREHIKRLVEKGSVALAKHILRVSLLKSKS